MNIKRWRSDDVFVFFAHSCAHSSSWHAPLRFEFPTIYFFISFPPYHPCYNTALYFCSQVSPVSFCDVVLCKSCYHYQILSFKELALLAHVSLWWGTPHDFKNCKIIPRYKTPLTVVSPILIKKKKNCSLSIKYVEYCKMQANSNRLNNSFLFVLCPRNKNLAPALDKVLD